MTKLKTLKDFNPYYRESQGLISTLIFGDIKQEAIKWVKESRRLIKEKLPAELNEYSFMMFHNITEEDLK